MNFITGTALVPRDFSRTTSLQTLFQHDFLKVVQTLDKFRYDQIINIHKILLVKLGCELNDATH